MERREFQTMPFESYDGVIIGPNMVVTYFFIQVPVSFVGLIVAVSKIFGADDKEVAVDDYQGTNKAGSNDVKANAAMFGR